MFEDDDEFEVVSETRDEASAGEVEVLEFEEVRGLPSAEEMTAVLDEAKDVIDVQDSLGLFTDEDEEEEEEEEDSEIFFVGENLPVHLPILLQALSQSPLRRIGQALDRLIRSGRNEKERAAIQTRLVQAMSIWELSHTLLLAYLEDFYRFASPDLAELAESWADTWDRAFSDTIRISDERSRIQSLRALTAAFEIWSAGPRLLGTLEVLGIHETLRREIKIVLTEIDEIESGLWKSKGLEALAILAQTITEKPLLTLRIFSSDPEWPYREFYLEDVRRELRAVVGDENKVAAIHRLNRRTSLLLDEGRDAFERYYEREDSSLAPGSLDVIPPSRVGPPMPPGSGPRYADYIFYRDQNHALGPKVPTDQPLQITTWYQLEVAVRVKPSGIHFSSTEKIPKRREILEPSQKDPVTIWVTVEPDDPGDPYIEIEEPVKTLELPPLGDSSRNAYFRIRCHKTSGSPFDLAHFHVCLYYEFNLLETDVIEAEVVPAYLDPPRSRFALPYPTSFIQISRPREFIDFDHIIPRSMHVNIRRREGQYVLGLVFANAADAEVRFFVPIKLTEEDLGRELFNIRKQWYEIALGDAFRKEVVDDEAEFIRSVRQLAKAGSKLWNTLFLSVTKAGESAAYKAYLWLTEHPVEIGGLIQISFEAGADNFVFPWSLIYDKEVPSDKSVAPDLNGFWGIRYCLEQQIPARPCRLDEPIDVGDSLDLGFMVWDNFSNMADQKILMNDLASRSSGKLNISKPPISNPNVCYELLRSGRANILYFYTHGHTRLRPAEMGAGYNFQFFTEFYEGLARSDERRTSLFPIYKSVKQDKHFEADRSWIELTDGKMYLDEMKKIIKFQSRPVVILNMCESAQITPSFSESFIDFFLDRGADSVIGTECPMTIGFAHPFSKKFLTEIMSGTSVGMALLETRRYFMNSKNPLGLAYTLFGSATVSFKPPRF